MNDHILQLLAAAENREHLNRNSVPTFPSVHPTEAAQSMPQNEVDPTPNKRVTRSRGVQLAWSPTMGGNPLVDAEE